MWPGIYELRALYCAKYPARDGVAAESAIFAESGFPLLDARPLPPQIEAPKRGELASADPDAQALVGELAGAKGMHGERLLAPPEYLIPPEAR